jgi:hypothetical protein
MKDRRTDHHRVVDVEECARHGIRRYRERGLELERR